MLAIKLLPIDSLIPYISNSRTHDDKQIDQIAGSIKEFGFTNPLLIDQDKGIIAGHGRLLAARKLGLTEVPTIELPHLTNAQKKAYIIADNKMALNAGWNNGLLINEIRSLQDEGFDIELTGFDIDEIADLAPFESHSGLSDEDDVPEIKEESICKLGDVWLLGSHRLKCGDSTLIDSVEQLMNGEKADTAYCDPPYGANIVNANGKLGGDKPFGNIGNRVGQVVKAGQYEPIIGDETSDTARQCFNLCVSINIKNIIFWGAQYYAEFLPPNSGWIVWDKETDGSLGDGELAYSNLKKAVRIFKHKWSGMIKASEHGQKRVHPTQKPVALAVWCFENYGNPKSVIDLFGGSGSTLIACEKTNRKCFMMEITPFYCDVIIKRWQTFTGKDAILESSQQTFNELLNEEQGRKT
jgi:DNA modification methylase